MENSRWYSRFRRVRISIHPRSGSHALRGQVRIEVNVEASTVEEGRYGIGGRLRIADSSSAPVPLAWLSQGFGLARSRIAALRHVRSIYLACVQHRLPYLAAAYVPSAATPRPTRFPPRGPGESRSNDPEERRQEGHRRRRLVPAGREQRREEATVRRYPRSKRRKNRASGATQRAAGRLPVARSVATTIVTRKAG